MLFYFVVLLFLPLTEAVPSRVTGVMLSLVPGQAAITVTWDVAIGNQTIIRYEAEYAINQLSANGTTVLVQGADTLTVTITGLQRGARYIVRVRAVSNDGIGLYNDFPDQRITIPNVSPQVSVVSGQAAAIRVTWTKSTIEGTVIGYDVQYKTSSQDWDGIGTMRVMEENTVTVDLTNLQRGTTYNVRVRAVSNTDNGPYSAEATFTLPILPLEVTGVSLSVVAVEVSWNERSVVGNFIRYEVEYKTSPQSWNTSTTETVVDENVVTVDLTNLQRGTTYNVRVRAVYNAGNGPYSTAAIFTVPNIDEEAAFEISTSPLDSHAGVIVGVFVAGLVAGVLGLLLVIGIVFGACKLIKQPNKNGSKAGSGSGPNAVEMTQSSAYESVGEAYEDVDHPTQQRGLPPKINEEYAIIELERTRSMLYI